MTFKEELQALIYKHLPPTSTAKDYELISTELHDEADRIDTESELFYVGFKEPVEDNDPELPSMTQAEAGIVPRSEYIWENEGEIGCRARRIAT